MAAALALAGCGASGGASTTARATRAVDATLASRWDAIGRPAAVKTKCTRSRCVLVYDYTPPDGYRREYKATVAVKCRHTCSARWIKTQILRKIGLDANYPVGQCAHAINKALNAPGPVDLATNHAVQVACAGVHKGVYTGPLLTPPGG